MHVLLAYFFFFSLQKSIASSFFIGKSISFIVVIDGGSSIVRMTVKEELMCTELFEMSCRCDAVAELSKRIYFRFPSFLLFY